MEQNWLSSYEEAILIKPNTSIDAVRRKRITEKVELSLNTLEKVAISNKINFEKIWNRTKITTFLAMLIRYDPEKSPTEEFDKLEIAGSLISIGLNYYSNTFKSTKLYASKIKEVKDLIQSINELIQMERVDKKFSKLYTMRRTKMVPPDVRTVGNPSDWKARCDICWNYATGGTKEDAMEKIRHHPYCNYPKYDLEYCIRTFEPVKK